MLETIIEAIVKEKYNCVCTFVFQEKKRVIYLKLNVNLFQNIRENNEGQNLSVYSKL